MYYFLFYIEIAFAKSVSMLYLPSLMETTQPPLTRETTVIGSPL